MAHALFVVSGWGKYRLDLRERFWLPDTRFLRFALHEAMLIGDVELTGEILHVRAWRRAYLPHSLSPRRFIYIPIVAHSYLLVACRGSSPSYRGPICCLPRRSAFFFPGSTADPVGLQQGKLWLHLRQWNFPLVAALRSPPCSKGYKVLHTHGRAAVGSRTI